MSKYKRPYACFLMSAIKRQEQTELLEEIERQIDEVELLFLEETDRKLKEQYWEELQELMLSYDSTVRGKGKYQ